MKDLPPAQRKFILHWGEMGTRWGINRTVAQIHALLFTSPRALNAEEIAATLNVARSNVSTSLKELQSWGIVRLVHLPNDRRDHFESLRDVYDMFKVIALERKKREIDPTLAVLRDVLQDSTAEGEKFCAERVQALLEFFELAEHLARQSQRVPTAALVRIAKMSDSLFRLLGIEQGAPQGGGEKPES